MRARVPLSSADPERNLLLFPFGSNVVKVFLGFFPREPEEENEKLVNIAEETAHAIKKSHFEPPLALLLGCCNTKYKGHA